jgi:hypothetical protein
VAEAIAAAAAATEVRLDGLMREATAAAARAAAAEEARDASVDELSRVSAALSEAKVRLCTSWI